MLMERGIQNVNTEFSMNNERWRRWHERINDQRYGVSTVLTINNSAIAFLSLVTTMARWIIQITVLVLPLVPFEPMVAKAWSHDVPIHKVPLRRSAFDSTDDESSASALNKVGKSTIPRPYCFAASSISDLTPDINFLATQVWPSARTAAFAVESNVDPSWTICEFGCGPGLPSLTAANVGCQKVIATDIDSFALELVENAAIEQGLESIVETRILDLESFDLTLDDGADKTQWYEDVDLFIFSDVFESSHVAHGAARISQQILDRKKNVKIWVFSQTDRSQREHYLDQMKDYLDDDDLAWRPFDAYKKYSSSKQRQNSLWLCDVDETKVNYG